MMSGMQIGDLLGDEMASKFLGLHGIMTLVHVRIYAYVYVN